MSVYYTESEIQAQLDNQGVSESAFLARFIRDAFLQDTCEYLDPVTVTVKINAELALLLAHQHGVLPEAHTAVEDDEYYLPAWKWRTP
jgi:hypothetical protein